MNDILFDSYFWAEYLPLLSTSIKVDGLAAKTPREFTECTGWGSKYLGYSWADRASKWYHTCKGYDIVSDTIENRVSPSRYTKTIPLFGNYAKRAHKAAELKRKCTTIAGDYVPTATSTKQEKKMNNKFKATAESVIETNKEAVNLAAKLGTGKTANQFFLSKLVSKLPWYAKFFSKKKDVTENPIAKLVSAETALTLVTHFAPDNKKLNYIADAMVQEALVDVTVNSQALEKIINELDERLTLPKELFSDQG